VIQPITLTFAVIPIDGRRRSDLVDAKVDEPSIRPRDTARPVRQLRGGSQQKVVLAKWLLVEGTELPEQVFALTAGLARGERREPRRRDGSQLFRPDQPLRLSPRDGDPFWRRAGAGDSAALADHHE
jgi:hypothetical protein